MALLDFLKKKEESAKAKEKKQPEKKPAPAASKASVVKEPKKEVVLAAAPARYDKKTEEKFSYIVVHQPHISEKATYLGEQNKHIFKVYERANKPQIKKAVEGIYGVDVLAVNMVKIPPKKRRLGRTEGFKKGHTKAVLTIKKGQKIEIF